MPDPIRMMIGVAVAGSVAALIVLLARVFQRGGSWPWIAVGRVLAIGAGFYLGCLTLGVKPRLSLREDQDRLLGLLLPGTLLVELLAAHPAVAPRLIWILRTVVAMGAAPLLLHGSVYLTDLAGPGTREWSPTKATLILATLGLTLLALWSLLARLARRSSGVSLSLAIVLGGAAVTIMLSGYATGGQSGLPMAAALGGVAVASLALSENQTGDAAVGVGLIGLFGLLVVGRFFGELTTFNALALMTIPFLCWLPELPRLAGVRRSVRGVSRVAVVILATATVVVFAQRKFAEAYHPNATPGTSEPSLEDYMSH